MRLMRHPADASVLPSGFHEEGLPARRAFTGLRKLGSSDFCALLPCCNPHRSTCMPGPPMSTATCGPGGVGTASELWLGKVVPSTYAPPSF